MSEVDREKERKRGAIYREANREKVREQKRAYYRRKVAAADPEFLRKQREWAANWQAANKEYSRATARRTAAELRAEVLVAYGDGTCAHCGASGPLELDHVNNDGAAHRGEQTGSQFYSRLRQLGWPNDPPLQTLCRPCHLEKTRAARTHCGRGHELTPENVYEYVRNGYVCRTCRTCNLAGQSRRRAAKR